MKLTAWGHPYSEFPEGKDSPDDFMRAFERWSNCGIERYIPFVSSRGTAYYDSSRLKVDRDLLSSIVKSAKEFGVEVHPILGLGPMGAGSEVRRYRIDTQRGGLKPEDIPSWARDWTCPSWEENRADAEAEAGEVAENYDIDGIHLDHVRYPNTSQINKYPCECEACCKSREPWLGHGVLTEEDLATPGVTYREIQHRNSCVKDIALRARRIADRHGLKLSMAARAWYLRSAVAEGQDWPRWCEEGVLDFICPMNYNLSNETFKKLIDDDVRLVGHTRTALYPGIGRSSSAGKMAPAQMIEQVSLCEEIGSEGVCIFHLNALTDEDIRLLKGYKKS
ncbi:MAG: hypothetical protein A3F84_21765 [Candidatus Handelsmanbacteria bacterium RIFCSPLOWO2_12_FULL_64_10]|uniref:Glycosyl hydrolase-like 10 domain-containing protein n=1 Tax=Handelsmanbacteria sp. (strain RIFCSPLOWO2_12_FULL_64_10) TaxID=1817868 RepID=A0A1F6D712_HANXR|nr:MAG: hypothetical protein A3F84_21765 [Candidatus Handelsmanbacteria bacterium RIFCSPLOWO2_12_FULL_64_10]